MRNKGRNRELFSGYSAGVPRAGTPKIVAVARKLVGGRMWTRTCVTAGHNMVAAASGKSGESAVARRAVVRSSGGRFVFFMLRHRMSAALLAGGAALLWAAPAAAQAAGVELRLGVAGSTALVRDAVATSTPDSPRGVEPVTARPSLAPVVAVRFLTPLRRALELELAAGWTFARLEAHETEASYRVQRLGIGQGTVGVRYAPTTRYYLRGAFGAIRYGPGEAGVLADGAVIEPMLEAGAGVARRVGAGLLSLELSGQAHPFNTGALQRAGGGQGFVYRVALTVGVALVRRGGR